MAQEITGLSSMATKRLLADLCSGIGGAHGVTVRFRSAGGVEAAREVREGAEVDIAILAETAMTSLEADGFLVTGSVRPIFVSEVVGAVPEAAPALPLATEGDLATALLSASRIAYSTGPSGTALVHLIDGWGLTDRVADKLVQAPPGVPVGELLARGEADLGFQQRSELMDLAGVRLLGALPEGAAIRSVFSGGVLATSNQADLSGKVLGLLASDSGRDIVGSRGMTIAVGPASEQT